jgi:hypothetical protein
VGVVTHRPARPGPSSQHSGVSWNKKDGKWRAQITLDTKKRHLGLFAAVEEAAAAYRDAFTAFTVKAQGGLPTHPARLGQSSQHRGVFWNTASGKWRAEINVNGQKRHLGSFSAEEDAATAYRQMAYAIAQGEPLPARPAQAEATSQHKGVSWHQKKGKWKAHQWIGGKKRHLGYFVTEEEATAAYRQAAIAKARADIGIGGTGRYISFGSSAADPPAHSLPIEQANSNKCASSVPHNDLHPDQVAAANLLLQVSVMMPRRRAPRRVGRSRLR